MNTALFDSELPNIIVRINDNQSQGVSALWDWKLFQQASSTDQVEICCYIAFALAFLYRSHELSRDFIDEIFQRFSQEQQRTFNANMQEILTLSSRTLKKKDYEPLEDLPFPKNYSDLLEMLN